MINNTEDITIKDFTSFYIKHKSKILKVFILGLFGVILFTFLSPPKFISSATILPKSSNSLGGLDYNAQIMGLDLGSLGSGKSSSPLLKIRAFPLIISGQNFIDELINTEFVSEKYGKNNLGEIISKYYRIQNPSSQKSKNKLYKLITSKLISVTTDNLSNSVNINVYMNEKQLSKDVLDHIIQMLNNFQNSLLQQKAVNKSEYLSQTIKTKKVELDKAEDSLTDFLEKNVNKTLSPLQTVQKKSLERDVNSIERIYITLLSEYEVSKIEAVENLDRLHIVSSPSTPHKKSSPSLLINVIVYSIFIITSVLLFAVLDRRTKKLN